MNLTLEDIGLELSAGDYLATTGTLRIKPILRKAEVTERKTSGGLIIYNLCP